VTEKVTVLVVVGVPDNIPPDVSDKPAGNVPLAKVYGAAELPLATKTLLVAL